MPAETLKRLHVILASNKRHGNAISPKRIRAQLQDANMDASEGAIKAVALSMGLTIKIGPAKGTGGRPRVAGKKFSPLRPLILAEADKGLSSAQIASKLGCEYSTVCFYRRENKKKI